ncbi:hypothetical protein Tco_0116683 [Tanacetum coccineum]
MMDYEDYTLHHSTVLSTEEPVNSLIMEDEHLDTFRKESTNSKASLAILVPLPSESKGVPKVCDVPFSSPQFIRLLTYQRSSEISLILTLILLSTDARFLLL